MNQGTRSERVWRGRAEIGTESEMIAVKYEAVNTICMEQKHRTDDTKCKMWPQFEEQMKNTVAACPTVPRDNVRPDCSSALAYVNKKTVRDFRSSLWCYCRRYVVQTGKWLPTFRWRALPSSSGSGSQNRAWFSWTAWPAKTNTLPFYEPPVTIYLSIWCNTGLSKSPRTRSFCRLNFVPWCLIFMGPQHITWI